MKEQQPRGHIVTKVNTDRVRAINERLEEIRMFRKDTAQELSQAIRDNDDDYIARLFYLTDIVVKEIDKQVNEFFEIEVE